MGEKLYNFYLEAAKIGGIKARTKLSVLTGITSMQASSLEDNEVNLNMYKKAMEIIYKEFGKNDDNSLATQSEIASSKDEEKLRKHIEIFADLTSQRSLFITNPQKTFERITESAAIALNVKRASIWLYNQSRDAIECKDLFLKDEYKHESGVILYAKDFPTYFNTISKEKTLAADDALTNPSTCEFSEVYLKPLGITSMLDVPIWSNNEMLGVICMEHVGPKRSWTKDDENFAYLISNIVGMSLEIYAIGKNLNKES
jgi:transcriptional regulator with GAF, ATPase, and Fis domain